MNVHFVLPAFSRDPIGGYRIVYQYANLLVREGNRVVVHHLAGDAPRSHVRGVARRFGPPARTSADLLVPWMEMDGHVQLTSLRRLTTSVLQGADAVIATSVATADPVSIALPRGSRGFYFIQHFEDFSADAETVTRTWRLPLTKIVIARWLLELANSIGAEPVHHVPNAIDTGIFRLARRIEERRPEEVLMLGHHAQWKGTSDGLRSIEIARTISPDIHATVFSVSEPPGDLAPGITWVRRPTQAVLVDLYNQAAIFLSPSYSEGWPLPPAEAMSCGAALITTDIPGVADYANALNAVLVPPKEPEAMADAILGLVTDNPRRIELAQRGHSTIVNDFSWQHSVKAFIKVLEAV